MPFNVGPWELILIFLIVLLIFGANRIPEIARGLGKGIRDFKRALQDVDETPRKDAPPADPKAESKPESR
jgi:sec-independent protein translocase protein TatA